MVKKELQDMEFIGKNNAIPNDQESDSTHFEYDINDIKQSIQETNKVIEKFAIDKEGIEKDKKNWK